MMSTKWIVMKSQIPLDTLFQLLSALKSEMFDVLAQHDISVAPMHIKVLNCLDKMAPCTAQELGQVIQRDKAQITRLIKDLEKHNLVERIPNPNDKRSQILTLKPEAEGILEKMKLVKQNVSDRMGKEVSEEEIQQFTLVVEKFMTNLKRK